MKKPFVPNGSLYREYYEGQQRGTGNFPVYEGRRFQRGHGIGEIFGRIFRTVLPFLKRLAPVALRTGAQVVEDVTRGRNVKESIKERGKEVIQPLVERTLPQLTKTGQQLFEDIAAGGNVKQSLKRGAEDIKSLVQAELNQSGSGRKRKKTVHHDIFDR